MRECVTVASSERCVSRFQTVTLSGAAVLATAALAERVRRAVGAARITNG
jgi:hypothetical protein